VTVLCTGSQIPKTQQKSAAAFGQPRRILFLCRNRSSDRGNEVPAIDRGRPAADAVREIRRQFTNAKETATEIYGGLKEPCNTETAESNQREGLIGS
jgi:hypothetical protein